MANNAVALVLGQGQGAKIKSDIEKDLDNYRFMVFDSLPQMIKSSEDNEQFFNKVIVYEPRITDPATERGKVLDDDQDPRVSALEELTFYLNSHSATEVVVVCTTDENFTQVSDFIDQWIKVPTVTPILPKKITNEMFKICASAGIPEIRSRFYTQEKKKAKTRTVKQSSAPAEKKGFLGIKLKGTKAQGNVTSQMSSANTADAEYAEPDSMGGDDSEFAGPAGDLGYSGQNNTPDSSQGQAPWGQESGGFVAPEGIAGRSGSLSFGDAGSNHEETGFLSEEDDFNAPVAPSPISQPSAPMPQSGGYGQYASLPDNSGNFGEVPPFSALPTGGGSLAGAAGVSAFLPPLSPIPAAYEAPQPNYDAAQPVYDVPQPVYDLPQPHYDIPTPLDVFNPSAAAAHHQAEFVSSDGENEADDAPNILDRIILVTGDRGSGVTTKAAELALEGVEGGSGKVLLIDLDFRKHGALGLLDDFAGFTKSGPHSIVSGKPYVENGLEILSDGYGTGKTTEAIEWVEDSRNYANYSKIIIDCPLEFVSDLGSFVSTVGIVYLVDGSQSGLMGTISVLDNRASISNEVALTFRDKGLFCVIRKEDNYREALAKLKGEVAVDRVDWLAKIV